MAHAAVMATWFEAQRALHLNHQQLADLVGSSKRTVERWSGGRGAPYPDNITRLAAAVYPCDPAISRRLASFVGKSLEALGIEKPPPPASPPPAPPPAMSPPSPALLTPLLVQSVVAAAAEALDVSPRAIRPAVLAAVECAKAAGLSVDDMLAVLRPPAPAAKTKKA